MNKKWYIHERLTPLRLRTEILVSDFVSLAMYRGLRDDSGSAGQAASDFLFLFAP